MPDKSSDGMKRLIRTKRHKPVKAGKKLERGSQRKGVVPAGLSSMKGPVRNKG
jgi:hypothetical protein